MTTLHHADDAIEIMEALMDIEIEGPPAYLGEQGPLLSCKIESKVLRGGGHSVLMWMARARYSKGPWTIACSMNKKALMLALNAEGIDFTLGT
jgi:hypothetical protein